MTSTADASTRLAIGERLYRALGTGDADVLRELLTEHVQGHLSAGLPHGDYLIGRGTYVGTATSTGKPVTAAFAHFWRFEGDRIAAVQQVTDSALWQQALEP